MNKDFLDVTDLTRAEYLRVFDLARFYRNERKCGRDANILAGRHIGLIFRKPSTRTRISFEVAVLELGGRPLYMTGEAIQISRGETVADTAAVLSRYLHGLVVRTHRHKEIEEYASHASFPVVNALTNLAHPCQAVSDYFTVLDKRGSLDGAKLTYIGDANNVCNSLILAADILGVEIRVVGPAEFAPAQTVVSRMKNPGLLKISGKPGDFLADADVVYTDTWVSMGDEAESERRRNAFGPFQVNEEMMSRVPRSCRFMHCLPAHRGSEVTDAVIDGPHSVVMDQAENRLHCQKALLHCLFERQ